MEELSVGDFKGIYSDFRVHTGLLGHDGRAFGISREPGFGV